LTVHASIRLWRALSQNGQNVDMKLNQDSPCFNQALEDPQSA